MKGIILAGGSGTRLYPTTKVVNKHLLPIYNKPMIYYPLSILMLAEIRDILIVCNPSDKKIYKELFKNAYELGINIEYEIQEEPKGLADGLLRAEEFANGENVCLMLGDNILYGHNLKDLLIKAKNKVEKEGGAVIFGYHVPDPERFGIVEFDEDGKVLSIEEKPKEPKSNYAIIGLYFLDNTCFEKAKKIEPSDRGEYEITSVLEEYLKEEKINVIPLGRGYTWFDAGTYDSFLEASEFIATIEKRTGYMIGCIEEIAFRNGWVNAEYLLKLSEDENLKKTAYGKYLREIVKEEKSAFQI